MKFTVITPCHNDALGLEKTIQSVAEQSQVETEHIVVVTKHSDDGSWECANKWTGKIILMTDDGQLGPEGAYNLALKRTTGDVISLLGCDDIYYPTALEKIQEAFSQSKEIQFVTALAHIRQRGRSAPIMISPMCKPSWQAVAFGGLVIRTEAAFWTRELMDKAGRFLTITPLSDYELWLRLLQNTSESSVKFLEEIVATFTFHDGQRSGKPSEHFIEMRNCRDRHLRSLEISKNTAFDQILHWTEKVESELIKFSEKYRQPYCYLPDHDTWFTGWPFEGRTFIPPPQPDLLTTLLPSGIDQLVKKGVKHPAIYGAGRHTLRILNSPIMQESNLQPVGIIDDNARPGQSFAFSGGELPVVRPKDFPTLGADGLLLSSDLYEDDMFQNACKLELPHIIRIYDNYFSKKK